MIGVHGSRLFGKVDEVPGLFHVATKFFHLNFVPLVPVESWLVIEDTGSGWRGQHIKLNLKSVLVTWLRVAMIVLGVVGPFVAAGCVIGTGGDDWLVLCPLIPLLAVGGVWWSYKAKVIMRPRYEQAVAYANQLGLNPVGHVMLEVAFGKMTKEEGDRLIAQLRLAPAEASPQA